MVVVLNGKLNKSLEMRGSLGRPNRLGEMWCGWTKLGDEDDFAGVYQRRPRKKGQIIVKMRHMSPKNPQTEAQNIVRYAFIDGCTIWNMLTEEEKEVYRKARYPKGLTGRARFMREYLRANI